MSDLQRIMSDTPACVVCGEYLDDYTYLPQADESRTMCCGKVYYNEGDQRNACNK